MNDGDTFVDQLDRLLLERGDRSCERGLKGPTNLLRQADSAWKLQLKPSGVGRWLLSLSTDAERARLLNITR